MSWNAGAERIKGYAAHEIIGQSLPGLLPAEEDLARGTRSATSTPPCATGSHAEEGWRVRKDGSRFWATVVISPVYDDDGRHLGFAKVTRDLTDQRQHEDERRTVPRAARSTCWPSPPTSCARRRPSSTAPPARCTRTGTAMSVVDRNDLLDGIRSSADRLRRLAADLGTASRVYGDALDLQPGTSRSPTPSVAPDPWSGSRVRRPIVVDVPLEARLTPTRPARPGPGQPGRQRRPARCAADPLTGVVDGDRPASGSPTAGPGSRPS